MTTLSDPQRAYLARVVAGADAHYDAIESAAGDADYIARRAGWHPASLPPQIGVRVLAQDVSGHMHVAAWHGYSWDARTRVAIAWWRLLPVGPMRRREES